MPNDRHARLVEVFSAATDLQGDRRRAYLDQACGDDADLRTEVEALLLRDEQKAVLDTPVLADGARVLLEHAGETSERTPKGIGAYTILGLLGEGGMGTVYKARQANPERLVALKVIRSGLPTRSLLTRFQYEAQVLGRLRHPVIAQVYEAGYAGGKGRPTPFIAMELVEGAALDAYVEKNQLDLNRKLQLFHRLALGVHHAHCHGVIHRDLKPSNILVDAEGNPKILDFGLAKLTDADVAAVSVDTEYGRIRGTLAYMSPEQAQGDSQRIDLLTDVYSLGIILYELVVGQAPYDTRRRSLPDALRAICGEAPRRPSSVVRSVPKDLEIIIVKAIEKEPSRRYQSAAELAADIQRFQMNQPIAARPASTLYHLRKLVGRHKIPAALLGVLVIALAGFAGSMTVMYRSSERMRVAAVAARESEAAQRENAETAEREARQAAETAEETSRFLQAMLSSIDPAIAQGRDTNLLQMVLEQASARLEKELEGQPEVQAEIGRTIGKTYHSLGLWNEAELHLRRALELQRASFAPPHSGTARTADRLAALLTVRGRYEEAEALFKEALNAQTALSGDETPYLAETLCDYAWLHAMRGEYAEAESKLRQALTMLRPVRDRYREGFTRILNDLGVSRYHASDYEEAKALLREALAIRRTYLPDLHPYIATNLNNLAAVLQAEGDDASAIPLYQESLSLRRELLGAKHESIGNSLNNLAVAYQNVERWDEAEAALREAIGVFRMAYGNEHPSVAHVMSNLGDLLRQRGHLDEAAQWLESAYAMRQKMLNENHPDLARTLVPLGELRLAEGDVESAERLVREALRIREAALPPDHWFIAETRSVLGSCMAAAGRFEDAESLLVPAYDALRAERGDRDRQTKAALRRIVAMYEAWGRDDQASTYAALLTEGEDARPGPQ